MELKDYENMTIKELIVVIDEKDNQINKLESDIELKDSKIYDLNETIYDLKDKLEDFEDLKISDVIIKQINILTTDEVAKIYYAIQDSYHFQHLDKFKPI